MKKLLLLFDGFHFPEGAFEFARLMNERQPVLLTGIFLPQTNFATLWSYAAAAGGPVVMPVPDEQETALLEKNVGRFENLCLKNGIEFRVHQEVFNFELPELKKETRYADLLLMSGESFFANISPREPNEYMEDSLHVAECPVLVVPEKFKYPEHNILAFDGSDSSVFAIRQFAYLFPELCTNKTLLVYARENKETIPNLEYMEELAGRHFNDLSIMKLDIDPGKYFSAWVQEKKNPILVCGAFGRGFLSLLLKRSFVADVIRGHQLPVFIAHR